MKNKRIISLAFILLAGCQIHKPAPVERVQTGQNAYAGSTAFHQASRSSSVSSARSPVGLHSIPSSSRSSTSRSPASTTSPTWAPISIQPIHEPTQPLTEYKFKPKQQSQKSSSKPRTQPSNRTAPGKTHLAYGSQLDSYDWQNTGSSRKPVSRGDITRGVHKVARGENLYAIARQYGVSVKVLARMNKISPPYEIYPNQEIYIDPSLSTGISKTPSSTKKLPRKTAIIDSPKSGDITWGWPAKGKILSQFTQGQKKGIDIGGQPGDPVRATADGKVIYSGNEVTGYGALIIIDHGKGYLSTYAHNRKLLVENGQSVKKGEQIAQMGSTDTTRTKLHFEIRKNEKPIDPIALLPR